MIIQPLINGLFGEQGGSGQSGGGLPLPGPAADPSAQPGSLSPAIPPRPGQGR